MPNLLNALEVKERLQVKPAPMLVEALPEKYFRDRHLPGAINLPHDSSDPEIRRILPDLEAEIIVYGASIDFWRRPAGHQAPRQRARHAVPDILGTNFFAALRSKRPVHHAVFFTASEAMCLKVADSTPANGH